MKTDYIVITPAYNEASNMEATIRSVASQTLLPRVWVIVDDGSEDGTWGILESASRKYPWIKAHRRVKEDKQGIDGLVTASEAKAFLEGYRLAEELCPKAEFVVKLDADLQFGADYFSKLLARFLENPKLGVAGGVVYEFKGAALVKERVSTAHVRGATKVYRRDCYQSIQGVHPVFGWDVIDEILARSKGWHVCSFEDIQLIHLRPTASRGGRFSGWVRNGYMAYYIGMSPLRMLLRAFFRVLVARDVVQAFGLAHGYFSNYIQRTQRLPDEHVRKLVRQHEWVTAKQSVRD